MNGCDEVRDILVASARGEAVSAPGQRFLREHVESCAACARQSGNQQRLTAGLAALAAVSLDGPPPALKNALMREFQQSRKVVPIRRVPAKWAALAVAAAAALLLVLAPRQKAPKRVTAPVKSEVARTQAPAIVPPAPEAPPRKRAAEAPAVRAKAHPLRRPQSKPVAVPPVEEPAEIATEFFPIPYTEPLRPEQRGDVYRIQVPRASMAGFGLPVPGGRLDGRISADVLMGEDGVARAVRFIR